MLPKSGMWGSGSRTHDSWQSASDVWWREVWELFHGARFMRLLPGGVKLATFNVTSAFLPKLSLTPRGVLVGESRIKGGLRGLIRSPPYPYFSFRNLNFARSSRSATTCIVGSFVRINIMKDSVNHAALVDPRLMRTPRSPIFGSGSAPARPKGAAKTTFDSIESSFCGATLTN